VALKLRATMAGFTARVSAPRGSALRLDAKKPAASFAGRRLSCSFCFYLAGWWKRV